MDILIIKIIPLNFFRINNGKKYMQKYFTKLSFGSTIATSLLRYDVKMDQEESIYNLIPREYIKPPKPPRYINNC